MIDNSYDNPCDATRLRRLLLRANLSQRAAADELGVNERLMRRWCAYESTPPKMVFLALERLIDLRSRIEVTEASSRSGKAADLIPNVE